MALPFDVFSSLTIMWHRLLDRFLTKRGEFDPKGAHLAKPDQIALGGVGCGIALLPFGLLAPGAAGLGLTLTVLGLLVLTRHFPGGA